MKFDFVEIILLTAVPKYLRDTELECLGGSVIVEQLLCVQNSKRANCPKLVAKILKHFSETWTSSNLSFKTKILG